MPKINTSKTDWDLSVLYRGDEDPKIEKDKKIVEKENYKFINKWKDREDYLKDPKVLKEAMDEYEDLLRTYDTTGDYGYYFGLRSSQDQNDPKIKAEVNKIRDHATKIYNDLRFFEHRLSKVSKKQQKKFLSYKPLEPYHYFLKSLFKTAKYLLSEEQEKIMVLKSPVSHSNWVKMTSGILAKQEKEVLNKEGKKEKKNFSEILGLANNKDKKVRDTAAKALNEIFKEWIDVGENELNSVLQNKKINDELRGYERPDKASLVGDDVDTEVIDTLLNAVSSKYDQAKRYYKLKAKLFDVKKLEYHERNLEYGEIEKEYKYEESANLVYEVLLNLDKEFADIYKKFTEEGFVDAFPKKGKQNGAFCSGSSSYRIPTFILLNHTDQLTDVLTIAHETGHGVHNELQKPHQNALTYGTSLATAEVASTFLEDFVLQKLLKEADDKLRLTLLMQKLNDDISTIHRQIAFYKFEWDLHHKFREKGYLSKEEIGSLFQKHMKSYMGDYVKHPEESKNWWLYVNHFRYFFYVYSYASGLLISKSLQNMVKQNPKNIEKVKKFLKAGASDSPKNIFASVGIDITDKKFWDRGLEEVGNLLDETEQLAEELGKL